MNPSVRAPRGTLLLFGGGAVAAVASFLPWARISVLSVRGTSTIWGAATLAAGVLAAAVGYRMARGHRPGRWSRTLAVLASIAAVAIPVLFAAEAHRSLLEERLDDHLRPHGLQAADLLGDDGHPSLFEQYAPFPDGDAAAMVDAVERSLTIRPDAGPWVAFGGGLAMSAGAFTTTVRRQRHGSADLHPGDMTTNTSSTTSGVAS